MELGELIKELGIEGREIKSLKDVDKLKVPQIKWVIDEENCEKFNKLYEYCLESLNEMIVTASGSISYDKKNIANNIRSYHVEESGAGVSLVAIADGVICRLSIGSKSRNDMSGYKAYIKFRQICAKYGICLDDYKVSKEEGLEAKKRINAPLIYMKRKYWGITLEGVHHIDFHSSYPAGLIKYYPEFTPVMLYLYNNRKVNQQNKDIMNKSIGYFQSSKIDYALAPLTEKAMNDNYSRVIELAERLVDAGREIIGYNTDGIWYKGPVYHGEGEGEAIGDWSNDKDAMMFRAWSNGAYEWVDEQFKVHVILRGLCALDKIEPDREKWKWGDMRSQIDKIFTFYFDEDKGFVKEKE